MITLFHNPRCSKSREALALLQAHHIEPAIRLYIDNPPDATELRNLLKKLKLGARQLLRTGEESYKTLNLKREELTDEQLIDFMVQYPKLIERPIAIKGQQAVIGRPAENVLQLIDN